MSANDPKRTLGRFQQRLPVGRANPLFTNVRNELRIRLIGITSFVACSRHILCPLEERVPILCLRPRLEVVEGDVGELTAERCAIDRVADTVEPLVHLGAVLTHELADDVQRDLEISERATGDPGEDGEDVVGRELVAPEVETLACEAAWVLEDANGDGPMSATATCASCLVGGSGVA
jgi:hypothetical protein